VEPLKDYYRALLDRFGPQGWWPGETRFEVMVGAILTQNTAWKNVEKAIGTLRTYGLLDPHKIHETDQDTLALAIKPAGYFNVKAKRLKAFADWLVTKHHADAEKLTQIPLDRLREELLEIKGIGPETADSILLYALDFPTFVVDAYTYRVLTRHNLIGEEATYEDMKDLFERNLGRDRELFGEFHALIVAVGKKFCRATARCEECPLRRFLPGK